MMQRGGPVLLVCLLLLASWTAALPVDLADRGESSTSGRATTTWSGVLTLTSDHTVAAGDTLVIDAGTTVQMTDGVRIYVEGELDITGTAASPVTLTTDANAVSHEGIQFNATSRNRGSQVSHLVIEGAEWGITIYDSDPILDDVHLENPDYVGIDLFNGADPTIRRLSIQGGGQDVAQSSVNSRYGIGLSVGAGSNPLVLGATMDDLTTRGINMWGNSQGFLRDLVISNVSAIGTGGWLPAGIWVEDSVALYDNVSIHRSDNGIWVRHITPSWSTRPTFRDITVTDSQYRGVHVEQDNTSNWNAPLNGIFTNLEVRGTGGPGAKTPGLCFHAIGVNTSGIDLRDSRAIDNVCNGFKAYMIDSATIIDGLEVEDSGNPGAVSSNDRSGVFIRSSNWAPQVRNLTVSGSPGHGIQLWKTSLQGHAWSAHNNTGVGLWAREAHPDVSDIHVADNGLNGLRVYDSSNVELYDLVSERNGGSALLPADGFGLNFEKSNDLMSNTKNVSCTRCSSTEDTWGGLRIEDSVDIQIHDLEVRNPGNGALAVQVDNNDLNFPGWVDIHGLIAHVNRTGPAVLLSETEARLSGLALHGTHDGLSWDGSGDARTSAFSNSVLSGANCLDLNDLHLLVVADLDMAGCSGQIDIRDSTVNMTQSTQGASVSFDLTGQPSTLRWIDSGALGGLNIGPGSLVDEMWSMHAWAINQHGHGLPGAVVNLSFSQHEADQVHTLPYSGHVVLGPFLAQRTDFVSSGAWTDHWVGCDYDGQRNDSGAAAPLPTNRIDPYGSPVVICEIVLTNQAPLIVWEVPLDEEVFPSGAQVLFNASDSWDLDDDPIGFTWTSSIDGVFSSADRFTANDGGGATLSDGAHVITLDVCDDQGNCANESRDVELRNLPPVIDIQLTPGVDFDGILRMYRTADLEVNMSGTDDPEGDTILCAVEVSYRGTSGTMGPCPMHWNESFTDASDSITQFDYTLSISDGVNPPVDLVYAIELVNDLPHPTFDISRIGNTSAFTVVLDGLDSVDPEGDGIIARWTSDLIGELPDDGDLDALRWMGRLPAGTHEITLSVSDDRAEHIDRWRSISQTLMVNNTPATAMISSHGDFTTESGALHLFEAEGSGDWDLPCSAYSDAWAATHICSDLDLPDPDNVAVRWDSSLVNGALGTDWTLQTRLPAGVQDLSFTVDDSVHPPAVSTIRIEVFASAPILILTSPVPGIEVDSDGPVLFDFRESFDPDGDIFWVNVTSDLLEDPIVENGTTGYWYNDELPAGVHTLTFNLTDATGMSRLHSQILHVNPTDPHAVIGSLVEGQYIAPGDWLVFDANGSWDADEDIIQYLWHQVTPEGTVELANDIEFTRWIHPGTATFTLTVRDSRGASDTAWVNVTVGASNPVLSELDLNLQQLESEVRNTVVATVLLQDADGTTQLEGAVLGRLLIGGEGHEFTLLDDGVGHDVIAGDGIYSGAISADVEDGEWASIEVWAADGEMSSNVVKDQLPIHSAAGLTGFAAILGSNFVLGIVGVLLLMGLIGGLVVLRGKRRLAADLELIESWGGGLGQGSGGFDIASEEPAPDLPDMDAPAPPVMSDFGEV